MIPGVAHRRQFRNLSEQEVLALAISSEEDDGRIYRWYAQRLRADLVEGGFDLRRAGVGLRDQPLAGLRVGRDRGQRLVDLVRDAGGHFTHGRDATEVRDAILHLTRFVFSARTVSLESLNTCGWLDGLITSLTASRLVVPIWTPSLASARSASA